MTDLPGPEGPRTDQTTNPPSPDMSIDKSLKRKVGGTRNRCVLTRVERITKMLEQGKFKDGQSPFGLPKTRVQKIALKKKAKKEAAEGDEAAAADAKKK
jgi:small basic protein (TIGR04137 family)